MAKIMYLTENEGTTEYIAIVDNAEYEAELRGDASLVLEAEYDAADLVSVSWPTNRLMESV